MGDKKLSTRVQNMVALFESKLARQPSANLICDSQDEANELAQALMRRGWNAEADQGLTFTDGQMRLEHFAHIEGRKKGAG